MAENWRSCPCFSKDCSLLGCRAFSDWQAINCAVCLPTKTA